MRKEVSHHVFARNPAPNFNLDWRSRMGQRGERLIRHERCFQRLRSINSTLRRDQPTTKCRLTVWQNGRCQPLGANSPTSSPWWIIGLQIYVTLALSNQSSFVGGPTWQENIVRWFQTVLTSKHFFKFGQKHEWRPHLTGLEIKESKGSGSRNRNTTVGWWYSFCFSLGSASCAWLWIRGWGRPTSSGNRRPRAGCPRNNDTNQHTHYTSNSKTFRQIQR